MNISATLLLSFRCPLFLSLFLLLFFSASAQDFQWVKGGGTNQTLNFSTPGYVYNESTRKITTDKHGNIYAASIVGNYPMVADTFYKSQAYGGNNNILITSYDCDGQMRWARLIGSTNWTNKPYGLVADTLGNIYLAADMPHNPTLYIGYDTSITGAINNNYLQLGLIQLDTNGNFNWIRWVGVNDHKNYVATGIGYGTLVLDGQQNVHFIKLLRSGAVLMPADTSQYGVYDLTYNSSGTLLSAQRLDMDSTLYVYNAAIDPSTGTLYTVGLRTSFFPTMSYFPFLAAFDVSRSKIWLDTIGNQYAGFADVAVNEGHLYITGYGSQTFSFRSYSVSNPFNFGDLTYIMKTDMSGNPVWIKNFFGSLSVNSLAELAVIGNDKIASVGLFAGKLIAGNDTMTSYPGEGHNPYFVIVDTSGNLLKLEQIHGDGFYDWGLCAASDHKGNLYIGGQVENKIWGGGIPAYTTQGGNSDFFVMKYGYSCDCDSTPVASFTYQGSGTVSFAYSGTSSIPIDSLHWDFGDGTTATGNNPVHSYAASGTYPVCVTVFTNCGNHTYCKDISVITSVEDIEKQKGLLVYPNPADGLVSISYDYGLLEGSSRIVVYDALGRKQAGMEVSEKSGRWQLPTGTWTPDVYIIRMERDGQAVHTQRLIIKH